MLMLRKRESFRQKTIRMSTDATITTPEEGALDLRGRKLSAQMLGCTVFLVGMMGSGKSSVGERFTKSLGRYTLLDTDFVVEKLVGMPVADFFEAKGEAEFRSIESAVLTEAHAYVRMVISTGGGIVTVEDNWRMLLR